MCDTGSRKGPVSHMREFLRSISPRTEFLIVVAGVFGWFVLANLAIVFRLLAPRLHGDSSDWRLVVYESIVLVLMSSFLGLRGWSPRRIGLQVDARGTLTGIGLFVLAFAVNVFAWQFVVGLSPDTARAIAGTRLALANYSLVTIVAVSTVNPVFEEVFTSGYVISALKERRSAWFAINVSVALRLLCHLYQGVQSVVFILPLGLLFGYWYARTGKLWPLIVAHSLGDFGALLQFLKH
jgi:membrane protease YdiL (CAAX protease family)